MKFTERTREVLGYRRSVRDLTRRGYESIGGPWDIHRGFRRDHVITDAVIGPDRKTVYVRVTLPAPPKE